MNHIYFTLTGTRHYHGQDFLTPGMELRLVKEPDNDYDREAIRVELDGLGKVGYVANSPYTVQGESISAGRLYDKIGDTALGKVLYLLNNGVLCTLVQEEPAEHRGEAQQAKAAPPVSAHAADTPRRGRLLSHVRRSISFKKSSKR